MLKQKEEIIMKPNDDQINPQDIDQQIEQLARYSSAETQENNQSAQLVQSLRQHYEKERQQKILEHAWTTISQKYDDTRLSSTEEIQQTNKQENNERLKQYFMQQQTLQQKKYKMKRFSRWGTILAVAVFALVIGSTVVIMSHAAQTKGGPASGGGGNSSQPICTTTSTPAVYPTPPIATSTPIAASGTCSTPVVLPTPAPTVLPTPAPTVLPTPTPAVLPTPTLIPVPAINQ
jgi:hypothetical protein